MARRPAPPPAPWTPRRLLRALRRAYGPQRDWWPADHARHARDRTDPRWERIAGAVLVQNASWTQARRALHALRDDLGFDPRRWRDAPLARLERALRAAGTYRSKARTLRGLVAYFEGHGDLDLDAFRAAAAAAPLHARRDLLAVRGVGPETADALLLYAFGLPFFVVDAYTRRVLRRLGVPAADGPREAVAAWFTAALPPEAEAYAEAHALLVEHAKARCRATPLCAGCPLLRGCAEGAQRVAAPAPKPGSARPPRPRSPARRPRRQAMGS